MRVGLVRMSILGLIRRKRFAMRIRLSDVAKMWVIAAVLGVMLYVMGCASAPKTKEAALKCIKAKTEAGVVVYFCIDVGGDVRQENDY